MHQTSSDTSSLGGFSGSRVILSSASCQREPRREWFCVRCRPKHEHIAAANLRVHLDIDVVCPRIRFRKETRRGVVWFVEALFPGYIFAEFDFLQDHRNVHYAHGIVGVVHFGDKYPSLDAETIASLRDFDRGSGEILTAEPSLAKGDAVRVGEGVFRGTTATVSAVLPARDRVKILVEFLGGLKEVELPRSALLREGHPVKLLDRIFVN